MYFDRNGKTFAIFAISVVIILFYLFFLSSRRMNNDYRISEQLKKLHLNENEMEILSFNERQQKEFFDKKADERRSLIKNAKKLPYLQHYFIPQILCSTAVRVGPLAPGGKWLCNPWMVGDPCVVYSLGIDKEIRFENELFDLTKKRCKFYCFDDHTENASIFQSFDGIFNKWKISNVTNENKTEWAILDIAKRFDHKKIDFLKIDIEAAEYSSLPPVLNSDFAINGNICQILIEFHLYIDKWRTLLLHLEKAGFLIFYNEINYLSPRGEEYSFIHKSCLKEYGVPNFVLNKNLID